MVVVARAAAAGFSVGRASDAERMPRLAAALTVLIDLDGRVAVPRRFDAAPAVPPLVEAVKNGDAAALQQVDQGTRRRQRRGGRRHDGRCTGRRASMTFATAELLLRAGADVKAVEPLWRDAVFAGLHQRQRGDGRSLLLKAGADREYRAAWRRDGADDRCARRAVSTAVKLLLARGVDVNAKEAGRGQTALMWAASEGSHAEVVQALVEQRRRYQGCGPTGGFTPFLFAVQRRTTRRS